MHYDFVTTFKKRFFKLECKTNNIGVHFTVRYYFRFFYFKMSCSTTCYLPFLCNYLLNVLQFLGENGFNTNVFKVTLEVSASVHADKMA